MEKKMSNEFCELNEMDMYEVDGGWGGFCGMVESFLTNRLVWSTAKISYGRVGGLVIESGNIIV